MAQPEQSDRRRRWLIALFLVLVFPVVGFAIGVGVESKYQAEAYAAIEEDLGRSLTAAERDQLKVADLCGNPELQGAEACFDLTIAAATRAVAIVAGIVGLLLLAVVALVSLGARRDRDALLRRFVPALYLVLGSIAILVVLDGLLALSSVYLGIGVFAGRIFPIVLLGIAIGVLLGVAAVLRALLSARQRAPSFVVGRRIDPTDEPALHALVTEVANQVGTRPPDHILLGLDPEFYVTEVDVQTPDGSWRGRSVYLSLPLTRILTPGELRAVLGHEMGHFRGADTAYSQRFYPVYRGTGQALSGLAAAGGGSGSQSLALFPAVLILGLFMEGFAIAERAISRDRELVADHVGVEVASAHDLGTALMKLLAFAPAWGATLDEVADTALAGRTLSNASDRYVELMRAAAVPSALEGLDEHELQHPTDSHPPLSLRLDALGLTSADLAADALIVTPIPSADSVATHREELEVALTTTLVERIRAFQAMQAAAESAD